MSVFKKFPPEEKLLWYVEGVRRNPQFRAECDEAVKNFLDSDQEIKDELEDVRKYDKEPYRTEALTVPAHKIPWVIGRFLDSKEAEYLGRRWGLIEAFHYHPFSGFAIPESYYVAYPKCLKPVNNMKDSYESRHNPEKYYLDSNGMLHLIINPKASKKDIKAWIDYYIDKFRDRKTKGIETFDNNIIWRIFDMKQEGKSYWNIVKDIYGDNISKINPENCSRIKCAHRANFKEKLIIDKSDCGKKGICLMANAFLKNVKDSIKKAEKIIESIKPMEVLN